MPKKFRASNSAQLMACPGSANLELAIPGYEEPARDDMAGAKGVGTNVHSILEPLPEHPVRVQLEFNSLVEAFQALHHTKRKRIVADATVAQEFVDKFSWSILVDDLFFDMLPILSTLPPKMMRFIVEASERIVELRRTGGYTNHECEAAVEATWLPSSPTVTTDVVFSSRTKLRVIDYKTGVIPVEAAHNSQMLFYAASHLSVVPEPEEIVLEIIQPGNNSEWTITPEYLQQWMKEAVAADERVTNKDLTLVPGTHCTFCPANPHGRGDKSVARCPAKYNQLYPPRVDVEEIFDL